MTATVTYASTMAELRTEQPHSSLWPGYGSTMPMSGRYPNSMDPTMAAAAAAAAAHHGGPQHAGRPRSSQPSLDHSHPYARYSQEEADAYDRAQQQQHQQHLPPPLSSYGQHHNSLKRTFAQSEQQHQQPAYTEMVQDLRDDGARLTVGHDHKLLSFKKTPDKHTILDQHGRVQTLDLTAQLHGMFFLSEMPATSSDGTIMQPELTCYRRNLFQISGSLITPRGQLSIIAESGETVAVTSTEVTISAIESVDGHPVRLIVIPWKTPPPNSPETVQLPDQEPAPLPLIPFQDDGSSETEGEFAVYPIGWRRLQFRIATANNGRRKELQQHFVLHLKVIGTLANGNKAVLTEMTTSPIVVRGRSPRNFQARKEIPLLGSSAGSRGQALVETGLGIVAGPLTAKPHDPNKRPMTMDLPRSAFTFTAPKLPGSPMGSMRSNSYPAWSSTGQLPMPAPVGAGGYPPTTLSAEPYPKLPLSGAPSYTAEPQDMLQTTSMAPPVQLSLVPSSTPGDDQQHQQHQPPAIRTQYAYVPAPPPTASTGGAGSAQSSASHLGPLSSGSATSPALPTHGSDNSSTSLGVPRYVVDSGVPPRGPGVKSPRGTVGGHSGHSSVHSTGSSVPTAEQSPEYRYGPPSYASAPPSAVPATESSTNAASATASGGPTPRDYFPQNTWTTTAGEAPAPTVAYTNGTSAASTDGRPYGFPDQYKTGPGLASIKNEPHSHHTNTTAPGQGVFAAAPRNSFDAINHYQWGAT